MSRVLIIAFSDLASDPRVDRQIRTIRERHDVIAAGLREPFADGVEFVALTAPRRPKWNLPLEVARLLTRRYAEFYWSHPRNVGALKRLRGVDCEVVVANDLESLPLALQLGKPVVFDAHEYSPDELGEKAWWRVLLRPCVHWQCRRYIPEVASMITVAPTIADAYERDTGIRAEVVLNAPPWANLEPTAVHDPIRVLHHGAALRGRALEEMIAAAARLDARFVVDFVLVDRSPGYRAKLIRRARSNPRVRFPDPWPMKDLPRKANEYDIGLYSLPPVNLNHRYALPNKFFEFIQGRLAVAVGPSPEMARLVRQYGCGVVAEDFSAPAIADALNALSASAIREFKQASHVAASELCAEANEALLLSAVEDALVRAAPRR